jgi:hypothetical protein
MKNPKLKIFLSLGILSFMLSLYIEAAYCDEKAFQNFFDNERFAESFYLQKTDITYLYKIEACTIEAREEHAETDLGSVFEAYAEKDDRKIRIIKDKKKIYLISMPLDKVKPEIDVDGDWLHLKCKYIDKKNKNYCIEIAWKGRHPIKDFATWYKFPVKPSEKDAAILFFKNKIDSCSNK